MLQPAQTKGRPSAGPAYARLAEDLSALAYDIRLQLLDGLRLPRPLSELRISPGRVLAGENPDRPMARQTLERHVARLVDAGILDVVGGEAEARRYEVNPARLYAIAEQLRSLVVRYAGAGQGADVTGTLTGTPAPVPPAGPRLVLVHGVHEGKAFPLGGAAGRWLIGRRRGSEICLDYDLFVSHEHAALESAANQFFVRDLRSSKNGTFLNWQRIPKDRPQVLRPGDAIGVGRSLLSFVPG